MVNVKDLESIVGEDCVITEPEAKKFYMENAVMGAVIPSRQKMLSW